MAHLRFGTPVAVPLFALGGARPGQPGVRVRTLNDRNTFEITQNAVQHVASGVGTGQPAIDIGNGHCGDPIVAMGAGLARRAIDGAGALGIIIDHGAGVTSEYWHLAAWSVDDGARVSAGTVIGKLGDTGLGDLCHCHVVICVAGRPLDPEPHVFGQALKVGGPDEEDDVLASKTQPLRNSVRILTGKGTGIRTDTREDPDTLDERTTAEHNEFTAIGLARGTEFPPGSGNRHWYVFLKRGVGLRAIHTGVCEIIQPVSDDAGAPGQVTDDDLSGLDDLTGDGPIPRDFPGSPIRFDEIRGDTPR